MSDHSERWSNIGQAIVERMDEIPMSQAELVKASGVSDFTIRKLMRGTPGNYRPDRLRKVSKALGWAPGAILGATSDPPSVTPEELSRQLVETPFDDVEAFIDDVIERYPPETVRKMAQALVDRIDLHVEAVLGVAAESGDPEARPGRRSRRPSPDDRTP